MHSNLIDAKEPLRSLNDCADFRFLTAAAFADAMTTA
jgi:hypothetical protein